MKSWGKMITRAFNVEINSENLPNLVHTDYDTQKYDSITRDDVTVIIPTLNEEEAISKVLNDVLTNGYNNVLVIDGFSNDNTVSIAKKHGVKVVEQKGVGKTGAVKMALELVTTPYFVLMDGDCTYRTKDIEQFFPLMKKRQLVIGSRASGRENISHLNRFGNWVINKIFNFFFDTNLSDVCSGLYILETEFARNIPFKTEGFDVEVEIAAYTARNGVIGETCIDYYPRLGQQKLRPFQDGAKIISTIIRQAARART
jgi:dolichol-phosphate mannosyltransferase